jgi:endonuclease/exonuclease/phosphatase family metal-dependent hydrolase
MDVRVRAYTRIAVPGRRAVFTCLGLLAALSFNPLTLRSAAAQEVVLHAIDVGSVSGNWARVDSSSGAGNRKMGSNDNGWSSTDAPQASPGNHFEATFHAQAWVGYRVWLRMKAAGNSKWNDSAWVQFSDSLVSGDAHYRIGTGSALLVNLEECAGCGVSSWGWSGGAWWVSQPLTVEFPSDGARTIRIQTREDGVEIDQIVLSPSSYIHEPPGRRRDDTTILPRSAGSSTPAPAPAPLPANNARALPGTIQAVDFDNGANGTAYWDSSSGNSGGQYRSTDVDIETSSEGGYNVGWIGAGEWLNYTVNVASAGTYTFEFRVASTGGGTLHLEFNGQDKTGGVGVPATDGWQSWTTVRREATLSAGVQTMRVVFDTGNVNLAAIVATAGSTSPPSAPPPTVSSPYGGSARSLPGTVQAEDFDMGGNGVGYYDESSGNEGGAYRSTDVDIETTQNGGYAVGWAYAGEWLKYSVDVSSGANYRLVARVASAGSGGTFHVEFNGIDRTGSMHIPNTGGWSAYQDLAVDVYLDSGAQSMRLVLDSNGSTGAVGNFSFIRVENAAAAPPPPPPPPPPSPAPSGGRVRVGSWNIHFGHGDFWGQAQSIASSGVDVVALQEAQTWDENMPVAYSDRLRQLTGQTWHSVWAGAAECSGGCQGTMILSRYPIVDSAVTILSGMPVARALVDVGGVRVNVFSVHLEYFDTNLRSTQLVQFMDWSRGFGGPRIVGGDFNSWWGEWWIRQMESEYSDTWQDITGSDENGYTLNGTVRFDYLFRAYDQNWRVAPTACWTQWGSSDHAMVIADYRVQ